MAFSGGAALREGLQNFNDNDDIDLNANKKKKES